MNIPFRTVVRFIAHNGKRAAISIVGFALLATGIVGIVLPILPGPLLIIAGLAILATEYVWARRALNVAKAKAREARKKAGGLFRRRRKPT